MSKRKAVGWLVFAALVLVLLVPALGGVACYFVGSRFYQAGNYQAAVVTFSGAVRLNPRFARAYVELGSSYLALEKYAQAEAAFLKARGLQDESCASCGLGMAYHGLGRHNDAEKEFKRAISLDPADVCAYDQWGRMYYDLGKYQDSIATLKHAISLRPSFGTYMYLGNAYVYAREFAPGVDAYKQAIELRPRDVGAHFQLGIAYDYLHRYEEAAAEYKQAIKLNPNHASAHYSLAMVYLAMHNKPAALVEYEILRKINPKTAAELVDDSGLSDERERGKEKLYFIPLSDFPPEALTHLVTFCQKKTGIQANVTPAVPFVLSTVDARRQQVIAEEVIELMKRKYPNLVADPNAILIGLTDEDMYIRDTTWRFAFSYRRQGRFGVVSSARMNPVNFGESANNDLYESRMRKMVLKNIGLLYYIWPTNYDPNSLLYDKVRGVDDLDNMGEDF